MKDFKYNRWLIGFIVLGLAAALTAGFQRHKVEENNSIVELAIDYEGLVELAEIEGLPVHTVLRQAREAGITSLAVYETTLKKLDASGKVGVSAGSMLLKSYDNGTMADESWRRLIAAGGIKGEDVYITQRDAAAFAELKEDLIRRLGRARVTELRLGDTEVLAVKANYEKIMKWNMGLPRAEMRQVNDAGFYVIARPSNFQQATPDDVASVFARMEGFRISDVVFSGQEVLGYPNSLGAVKAFFTEKNLTLGMIEHPLQLQFYKQEGLMELAKAIEYRAARVYSIPKDEQMKMKVAPAVERWVTTDQERNIRINLLRTFEKPEPAMTLLATNMTYIAQVQDALIAKGFTIGKAGVYAPYFPDRMLLALMCAGAAAAGVLYLTLLMPLAAKRQYLLLAAATAFLIAPILLGHGGTVRSVVALASANLFPAIAVIWQLDCMRGHTFAADASLGKIALTGIAALLITSALSLIGGAYVGGVLADVTYILEINIYRGVKLTFVLPILLVSLAFLRRFDLFDGGCDDTAGIMRQARRILDAPVYVKSLVGLGLAAIAAIVFIGRSGHTAGIPVPGIELKFRAFLEEALYARPRSKEMLIGHPSFMLAVLAMYRKWPTLLFYVLVVLAVIGQGSMVETFAHIRTPIFMSLARGLGGVIFGAGIGVCLMIAAHYLPRRFSFAGRSTVKHE